MLLGARLLRVGEGGGCCRIVEVEAYTEDDPASHSFVGERPRHRTMFGPAGLAYVYRSYGVHWCLNVVTGEAGRGEAILLRAAEPLDGQGAMRARRAASRPLRDVELLRGPGNLCRGLGVSGADDGVDLLDPASPLRLLPAQVDAAGAPQPLQVACGTRVGISRAADWPRRWWWRGHPCVSRAGRSR